MKILEVIRLRSTDFSPAMLDELLEDHSISCRVNEGTFTCYRQHGLETDYAVHIVHDGRAHVNGRSELGLKLAAALRGYGMVEHTAWEAVRPRGLTR